MILNNLKVKIFNLEKSSNLLVEQMLGSEKVRLFALTIFFRNQIKKNIYRCDIVRQFCPFIIFSNVIIEFKDNKIYTIKSDNKSEIINLGIKNIGFEIGGGGGPCQFIDNKTNKNLIIACTGDRDADINENDTGTLHIIDRYTKEILFKYSFVDATKELKKKYSYKDYRNFPKHFDSYYTLLNFNGKKYLYFRINTYFGQRHVGVLESDAMNYNFKNLVMCTFKKCYIYCYHFLHFFYNNELYVISHNYYIPSIHDSVFEGEGIFLCKAENMNTFVAIKTLAFSKNTKYNLQLVGYDMINNKRIFYKDCDKLIELIIQDKDLQL
jgi:hypothetical protein